MEELIIAVLFIFAGFFYIKTYWRYFDFPLWEECNGTDQAAAYVMVYVCLTLIWPVIFVFHMLHLIYVAINRISQNRKIRRDRIKTGKCPECGV